MTDPILAGRQLHFAHPGEPPLIDLPALDIGPGATLLYGDTGAGKTTLLRILAGELEAHGTLTLGGARAGTAAYRAQVFYCDAGAPAWDALPVRDCTAQLRGDDGAFDEPLWRALVDAFSLAPHLDKTMHMLSTGSRRKVALAAALAGSRPLLLLDEPTASLDAGSVRALWRALAQRTQQPGRAVLIASSAQVDAIPLAATVALPLR